MGYWTKNKGFWLSVYGLIVVPSVILVHGWPMGLMVGIPTGMVALGLFTHWRYYVHNRFNLRSSNE
jgi:hypothetical protein